MIIYKVKFLQSNPLPLENTCAFAFSRFKTFLEGILWNLFELRRRDHFDGIDVGKKGFLQNRLDLTEEKKVTRGQIVEIRGVFQSCNISFCEKLTNT